MDVRIQEEVIHPEHPEGDWRLCLQKSFTKMVMKIWVDIVSSGADLMEVCRQLEDKPEYQH